MCNKRRNNPQHSQAPARHASRLRGHALTSRQCHQMVQCVQKEARKRGPVAAWRVSQHAHAPVRRGFQKPRAGFAAVALHDTMFLGKRKRGIPPQYTHLVQNSFRRWQYVVSLYRLNAKCITVDSHGEMDSAEFFCYTRPPLSAVSPYCYYRRMQATYTAWY